jgi:hypothetical protein
MNDATTVTDTRSMTLVDIAAAAAGRSIVPHTHTLFNNDSALLLNSRSLAAGR